MKTTVPAFCDSSYLTVFAAENNTGIGIYRRRSDNCIHAAAAILYSLRYKETMKVTRKL